MAKVLYVIHRFWPYMGGAERHFFELARRTAALGHTVSVFATDAWDIEHLNHAGRKRIERLREQTDGLEIRRFRVRHLPGQRHWLRWLSRFPWRSCRQLFGDPHILVPGYTWSLGTTRQRFDLVHAGVFPHTYLVASAYGYCRRQGVPLVCQPLLNLGEPHSAMDNPHFLSAEQLWLLSRASAILTNTAFEKEVLVAKGIPGENITVAGPGVTPAEVVGGNGEAFRQQRGITGPMVLQVSSQTFDKGSVHTVEALKLLWQRGFDVTLVMIGQVLSDFALYVAMQAPSVRAKLLILDYVSEDEKRDALAACDVFVMPSRADSFGIVYLEAWLHRKPVIGCYAGGVSRVVEDGRSGCLVPFGDVHMMAEYIAMLLSDRTLAARMGEQGYQDVMTKYTWEQSWSKVQEVYDRLLARGESG